MQTDDLVLSLAKDFAPVSRRNVERRIGRGLAMGAMLTMGAIAWKLGFRADLGAAMQGFPFWIKWAYTISLFAGALAATIQLSRPETERPSRLWPLVLPVLALAALAAAELVRTPVTGWPALLAGSSATVCSMLVLSLSLPIFGSLVWSFRKLAPGNLPLAGAMAGLTSGGAAATLYSLHCPESSALFILVWYSLGMVLAGVIGALAGPRLLRW